MVINGQDILVLLKLVDPSLEWTIRSLAEELHLARAGTHRSLQRLDRAGLFDLTRRRLNISNSEEFLIHAVRYLFPGRLGSETRGVPTAWAARPLTDILGSQDVLPPVWPDPHGARRGLALEPIHPTVPENSARDPRLGERLVLTDALRLGDSRVRTVARSLLVERLHDGARP